MQFIAAGIVGLILIAVAVAVVVLLIVPLIKGVAWLFKHVITFIVGVITDALRLVGALFTTLFFIPLVIGTIIVGRWSASAHYGRAIQDELRTVVVSLYRVAVGHPARLLCLGHLTEGIEKRIPRVVAAAPGADAPSKRTGQFEGYKIVGSLPVGGSGGKLYVAVPEAPRLAAFARQGQTDVQQVVIKSFSLHDGSSLPQIVREGRALDAARKLGLVLDHELTNERFYYVMRYVPGQPLTAITQSLHAVSDEGGLKTSQLRSGLSYIADLLRTLDQYHRGGLWHKDVKPDNIIVDGNRAHLVDFGLVTPLRSAMTLTTHGTEYFRDPEMVRLALRGVKVHQVDGAKFDLYGAGAVLYSLIENNFPAHGVLSRVTKRCPDAVRWICQRAMTDYDKRYASAAEMLADVEVVRLAADPMAVRPVDLPSFRGAMSRLDSGEVATPEPELVAAVASPASPRFSADGAGAPGFTPAGGPPPPQVPTPLNPPPLPPLQAVAARFSAMPPPTPADHPRPKAAAQLASARARMQAARERASKRRARTSAIPAPKHNSGVNFGVAVALFTLVFAGVAAVVSASRHARVVGIGAGTPSADARVFARETDDGKSLRLRFPRTSDTVLLDEPAASVVGDDGAALDPQSRIVTVLNQGYSPLDAVPEGYEQAVLDTAREDLERLFAGRLPAGRTRPTVLTVLDLPAGLMPESHELAQSAGRLLREAGLDVVGDLSDDLASERNVDLVAAAHAGRGQTPIDSPEFDDRLVRWLATEGDQIDFIVWVGTIRVGPSDFEPVVSVLGPADQGLRANVRSTVRRIFCGLASDVPR